MVVCLGVLFTTGCTRGYQYDTPTGWSGILRDCFVPRNDEESEKIGVLNQTGLGDLSGFLFWYGKLEENDELATAPDCTGNPFYSSFSEE